MILTSRPISSAPVSVMSLLAESVDLALATTSASAAAEKTLEAASTSASVRVESSRSPVRLRRAAPRPTVMLDFEVVS